MSPRREMKSDHRLVLILEFIGSFEVSSVLRNGVTLVPVAFPPNDPQTAKSVVDAFRNAAEKSSHKVRGLLFCNPQNPSGHIYSVKVLDALLQYCEETNIHFVSDEIYALSTFGRISLPPGTQGFGQKFESPATEFVSVLSRDLHELGVSGSRVHVIYSLSKDFGCSGIRFVSLGRSRPSSSPILLPLRVGTSLTFLKGVLITQSNKELRMSQAILNNQKLCTAATAMVGPILQSTSQLTTLVAFNIQKMRDAAKIAIQFAEFHNLTYYEPVAGVYIWLRLTEDCKTEDDEEAIVQRCAKQGALVGSGSDYSEAHPGWFRLTFSLPQEQFLEGLCRIETAMGYKKRFVWAPAESLAGGFVSQIWRTLGLL